MYFCEKFVAKKGPLQIHSLTNIPIKFFRNKLSPILLGTFMLLCSCAKKFHVRMTFRRYKVKDQITRRIYLLSNPQTK